MSISRLLELLEQKHGKDLENFVIDKENAKFRSPVLVNGSSVSDPDYLLQNGDRIHFLARTTGG
jgi:molybdopterin converting factor small subunit